MYLYFLTTPKKGHAKFFVLLKYIRKPLIFVLKVYLEKIVFLQTANTQSSEDVLKIR